MNIQYKKDIKNLLGEPNFKKNMTSRHRCYYYNIYGKIKLCLMFELDKLIYIAWYFSYGPIRFTDPKPSGVDAVAWHEEWVSYLNLEAIIDNFPEHWKNLVLFNMDIFSHSGYLDR